MNRTYQRIYGITLEEYKNLYTNQNGLCALCNKVEVVKSPKTGKIKKLAVDHCHTSGRVRGLLCYHCNVTLGALGDTLESAEKILNYMAGEAKYDK